MQYVLGSHFLDIAIFIFSVLPLLLLLSFVFGSKQLRCVYWPFTLVLVLCHPQLKTFDWYSHLPILEICLLLIFVQVGLFAKDIIWLIHDHFDSSESKN